MFKNPGKKLSGVVKVMFWILSILYVLFDIGMAVFFTFIFIVLDGALAGLAGSVNYNGAATYNGGISAIFIIPTWVIALLTIIPVIIGLYWLALFCLSVGETNTEMKEIKTTVKLLEEEVRLSGNGNNWNVNHQAAYYSPQPSYQQPAYQEPQPAYQQSQPVYQQPQPEMYYSQPEPYVALQSQPVQNPVQSVQQTVPAEAVSTQPEVKETVQKIPAESAPVEEPVKKELSKDDILRMYGPKGNFYN